MNHKNYSFWCSVHVCVVVVVRCGFHLCEDEMNTTCVVVCVKCPQQQKSQKKNVGRVSFNHHRFSWCNLFFSSTCFLFFACSGIYEENKVCMILAYIISSCKDYVYIFLIIFHSGHITIISCTMFKYICLYSTLS